MIKSKCVQVLGFVVFFVVFTIIHGQECPTARPTHLTVVENNCLAEMKEAEASVIHRVQEGIESAFNSTKSWFQSAKKRLGSSSSDSSSEKKPAEEPQPSEDAKHCRPYQCVFRDLKVLNDKTEPDLALFKQWATTHINPTSTNMMNQIEKCFMLVQSEGTPKMANAPPAEDTQTSKPAAGQTGGDFDTTVKDAVNNFASSVSNVVSTIGTQVQEAWTGRNASCDISQTIMKCLSEVECNIFKY